MPINYERLIANKESTIENVNKYISGGEQIDAKERDKELVTQITEEPVLLGADLILNLEEADPVPSIEVEASSGVQSVGHDSVLTYEPARPHFDLCLAIKT